MKYAVVTGASSGIGKEFARELDLKGYSVILVARRKEKLEELAKTLHHDSVIVIADLSKEEECFQLFDQIKDYPIEVVINNAGFGDYGYFLETDLNKEMTMIDVNIKALHILTKLFLSKMKLNDTGYILNVASSAGLMPAGPYMSTYYATKAYVTSLTRGIARELKENGSHIYVGCLCPGPVKTEFNDIANVQFSLKDIDASYCAKYAITQMFARKVTIIPTFILKLGMTLGRFLPVHLYIRISSHQQRKKSQS